MQMKRLHAENTLDLFCFIVDLKFTDSRKNCHEPINNRSQQVKKSTNIEA